MLLEATVNIFFQFFLCCKNLIISETGKSSHNFLSLADSLSYRERKKFNSFTSKIYIFTWKRWNKTKECSIETLIDFNYNCFSYFDVFFLIFLLSLYSAPAKLVNGHALDVPGLSQNEIGLLLGSHHQSQQAVNVKREPEDLRIDPKCPRSQKVSKKKHKTYENTMKKKTKTHRTHSVILSFFFFSPIRRD